MKSKKLGIYLSLFIFCFILGILIQTESEKFKNNSNIKVEFLEVHGDSLIPLINSGETVKLTYGYYNSHPVKRGDIVAYDYAGDSVPIIKIVKAIPGDKWNLQTDNQSNKYQIIVNGKPLKNSKGEFYKIPESNIKMLQLYARDYPIIPLNTYLILGNQTAGTLDATRFGLINQNDIVGKVEK